MKISELSVGDEVRDRWYPEWGSGITQEVKKTVVYIHFTIKGNVTYDTQHTQFLEWLRKRK